jgi:hypothetical protein
VPDHGAAATSVRWPVERSPAARLLNSCETVPREAAEGIVLILVTDLAVATDLVVVILPAAGISPGVEIVLILVTDPAVATDLALAI